MKRVQFFFYRKRKHFPQLNYFKLLYKYSNDSTNKNSEFWKSQTLEIVKPFKSEFSDPWGLGDECHDPPTNFVGNGSAEGKKSVEILPVYIFNTTGYKFSTLKINPLQNNIMNFISLHFLSYQNPPPKSFGPPRNRAFISRGSKNSLKGGVKFLFIDVLRMLRYKN